MTEFKLSILDQYPISNDPIEQYLNICLIENGQSYDDDAIVLEVFSDESGMNLKILQSNTRKVINFELH